MFLIVEEFLIVINFLKKKRDTFKNRDCLEDNSKTAELDIMCEEYCPQDVCEHPKKYKDEDSDDATHTHIIWTPKNWTLRHKGLFNAQSFSDSIW